MLVLGARVMCVWCACVVSVPGSPRPPHSHTTVTVLSSHLTKCGTITCSQMCFEDCLSEVDCAGGLDEFGYTLISVP